MIELRHALNNSADVRGYAYRDAIAGGTFNMHKNSPEMLNCSSGRQSI